MSARARIHAMVNLDETAEEELNARLDAYRAEVLAEVAAWLTKKAREYRATGRKQHALQADTVDTLASKISRGAVRPDNLRMLPPDFFEPGHTYAYGAYRFDCRHIVTHPTHGHRSAWGWFGKNGAWRHQDFSEQQYQVRDWTDITDTTTGDK